MGTGAPWGRGHHGSKSADVVIVCQGGVYSDEALTGSILEIGFQSRVIAQCRPSDLQDRFAAFDRIISEHFRLPQSQIWGHKKMSGSPPIPAPRSRCQQTADPKIRSPDPANTECRVLRRSVSSFLGNVLAGAFDFVFSHFAVERGGLEFQRRCGAVRTVDLSLTAAQCVQNDLTLDLRHGLSGKRRARVRAE